LGLVSLWPVHMRSNVSTRIISRNEWLTKASTRTGFSAALQSRPVTLGVMNRKIFSLLAIALIVTGCASNDCRPQGYLYLSTLELSRTQCAAMLGRNVSVIGFLYDDSTGPDNPRYVLLPGSDYAGMRSKRLISSIMFFFKNPEPVHLPRECLGKMVTVTGTVGVFSGIPAMKDVFSIFGPDEETCYVAYDS